MKHDTCMCSIRSTWAAECSEGASNCIKHLLLNCLIAMTIFRQVARLMEAIHARSLAQPIYMNAYTIALVYEWLCIYPYTLYGKHHLTLEFNNRCFAHATGVGRSFAAFGGSCTPGSIHPYCLAGSSSHRQQPPSNQTCHSTGTQVRLNCSSKSCKYVKLQPYIHGCRSMYIHTHTCRSTHASGLKPGNEAIAGF